MRVLSTGHPLASPLGFLSVLLLALVLDPRSQSTSSVAILTTSNTPSSPNHLLNQVMGWIVAASLDDHAALSGPASSSQSASGSLGLDWVSLLEDGACEDRLDSVVRVDCTWCSSDSSCPSRQLHSAVCAVPSPSPDCWLYSTSSTVL